MPIFISLTGVQKASHAIIDALSVYNADQMAKQLKASDYKFLFLFDGFDELKQPINLYDTNQLGSWGADVKIIVTSRNLT